MIEFRKYKKKPVIIDAILITEDNMDEVAKVTGHYSVFEATSDELPYIEIRTLEGNMKARPGEWLIRGIKGEYYPCKPEIFDATYELVSE